LCVCVYVHVRVRTCACVCVRVRRVTPGVMGDAVICVTRLTCVMCVACWWGVA